RRYAETQHKLEAETRRIEANRQFYSLVMNMGYALNGIPRWKIAVMSLPPEKRLDEGAFTRTLREYDNRELLKTVFRVFRPAKPTPETAVTDLRASVLGVKELLRRANVLRIGGRHDMARIR